MDEELSTKDMSFGGAIRSAITLEMERDPTVFVAGEDVVGGAILAQYWGLAEKFPGRVRNTPVSETAIAGLGLGAALMGMRPIIEFNLMDFTLVAMDEVVNEIAKYRFLFGGDPDIPLVMHASCGASRGASPQHAQSLEGVFAHIPGLRIVYPSNPVDAKGLMTSAIRSNDPVWFFDHFSSLGKRKVPVPVGEYQVPIGVAAIPRAGRDVTIVCYGPTVARALDAAEHLEEEGVSAEVVDLRTIVPWDVDGVVSSARRTGRVVVAHEAVRDFGVGAEIAATVSELAWDELRRPVARVGAPFAPVPFSPALAKRYIVSSDDIVAAAMGLMGR